MDVDGNGNVSVNAVVLEAPYLAEEQVAGQIIFWVWSMNCLDGFSIGREFREKGDA